MDKRENQRNKLWRRKHQARLFKKRLIRLAGWRFYMQREDGTWDNHPHWFELARVRWCWRFKSTGTVCGCELCRGERYNRTAYKKETRRIIKETAD